MKVDLHIHSTVSDCNYTIENIIKKAKESGLTHISITDHDTVLGIGETVELSKKYGINATPGIEISAYDFNRKRKVHILGYKNIGENVSKLCGEIPKKREEQSKKYFDEIKNKGYNISWDKIKKNAGKTGVFKQHIMLNLIENGYTDKIYGELYNILFKKETTVSDMEYVDVYDAVKAVKDDGGIAVIAHPCVYKNEELIKDLIPYGLDGIEVYHPKHLSKDIELLQKIAVENNLLITGGSDFHGDMDDVKIELGKFVYSPDDLYNLF
ncbi:MAG: PHP domain-containing protein [Fusobacteriaceae bacterium]